MKPGIEYFETSRAESKYALVIETTETGYSGYVPDLPGCVSVGRMRAEMDMNNRLIQFQFRPHNRVHHGVLQLEAGLFTNAVHVAVLR